MLNPFWLLGTLVVIELEFGIAFSDSNLHLMVLEINKIDSLKEKKVYLIQLCTLLPIGTVLL